MSERTFRVAVVGATGLVGGEIIAMLEERAFPVEDLYLYATEESAGTELEFAGQTRTVEALPKSLPELDVVFLCATAQVSEQVGPELAARGALVIDLEAAKEGTPLVLGPGDVGADDAKRPLRLADPATRVLAAALRVIAGVTPLRRAIATLVVPASMFGRKAVEDLGEQTMALLSLHEHDTESDEAEEDGVEDDEATDEATDEASLAFRCAPLDPAAAPSARIQSQLSSLLGGMSVTVHMVRAPMFFGEIFSVSVETVSAVSIGEVRNALREAPSIVLVDDVTSRSTFDALGIDAVQLTGLRQDAKSPSWIHFWALADNVRQGAALPAVALAEGLLLRH